MSNHKIYTLAALATLALATPALADDPSAQTKTSYQATQNGGYDKTDTTTSTDANGTTVTHKATKSVNVDSKGNTKTTVKIKDKTDPKGLMNATTNETRNTSTVDQNGTETTHTKTVNGTTVEKTDDVNKD
jgi:hypothetical protein